MVDDSVVVAPLAVVSAGAAVLASELVVSLVEGDAVGAAVGAVAVTGAAVGVPEVDDG